MKAICDIRLSTVGRRLHAMPLKYYLDIGLMLRVLDSYSFPLIRDSI